MTESEEFSSDESRTDKDGLDFLKVFDQSPEKDQWPLVRGWMKQSPRPFFKQLRQERPILVTPVCTILARYDDVVESFNHPRIFTTELYKSKMGDYLMADDTASLHDYEKDIMMSLLKHEDLVRIRHYVGEAAESILEQSQGGLDLVESFSRTVPVGLVRDVFGLDGISTKTLLKWSYLNQFDAFNNQYFQQFAGAEEITETRKKSKIPVLLYTLSLFFRKRLRILLGIPQNTTVTRMLQEQSLFQTRFHLLRQGMNAMGLLVGTVETTSESVLNAMTQLYKRPAKLERAIKLAHSNRYEDFDKMVWEALRFQPIAPYIMRKLSDDYTIASGTERETRLKAGMVVLNAISSAMFDPAGFKNPDEFDDARPYGNSFHFGMGSHECMGKMIGMVMIPEMVRQLLLRKNPVLHGVEFNDGPFPQSAMFSYDS